MGIRKARGGQGRAGQASQEAGSPMSIVWYRSAMAGSRLTLAIGGLLREQVSDDWISY